jgi:histidinol dehydrogenase
VLIVADRTADPWLAACDMLAQLEHDSLAKAVLVTDSMDLAASVERDLAALVSSADRRDIASSAAERGASFVLVKDMDEAIGFSNRYAPEHLLIDTADPWSLLDGVRNAGSVFLGRHSSVAFGDYCSGTNHILPTNGTAAASSALSVYDFIKVMPYQEMSGAGAYALSRVVATLASAEGLPGHAQAALARAGRVSR